MKICNGMNLIEFVKNQCKAVISRFSFPLHSKPVLNHSRDVTSSLVVCVPVFNLLFRPNLLNQCALMSVRLWNFKWWVLKCKIFAKESICWKEIVLKQSCDELWFVKKCRNCTFYVKYQRKFFKKKNFKKIHLRISI